MFREFNAEHTFLPMNETKFRDCPLAILAREEIGQPIEDLDQPIAKDEAAVEHFQRVAGRKETGEGEDGLFSTYKERLDQTPVEGTRGHWSGERGESVFLPSQERVKQILGPYGLEGIAYTNGIPDFSACSSCTVEIDDMSTRRYGPGGNFEQCDTLCAEKWNQEGREGRTDWTAREVQAWRSEHGYTWHERNDRTTCDLVPSEINDYFGHLGGVSECSKAEGLNREDEFDA